MKWIKVLISLIFVVIMSASLTGLSFAQTGNANWIATYYANENLAGIPVLTRTEGNPGGNWQLNAPAQGVPNDHWSARWSSTQSLVPGANYRLSLQADDGVRAYVNGVEVINEWHGYTAQSYTYDFTAYGDTYITLEYFDATEQAFLNYSLTLTNAINLQGQWVTTYYNNENLSGSPVLSRMEENPGGNWQFNAPAQGVPNDHWSARWSSTQNLIPGANYRLSLQADDGVRAYINGVRVIDEWHGFTGQSYNYDFTAYNGGTLVTIEYFDATEQAYLNYSLQQISTIATSVAPPPIIPFIPTQISTAARPTATVTVATLNVRTEPNINSPIRSQIHQGETYTVRRGSITGWVQIIINGDLGWVSRDFVTLNNTQYLVNLAGTSEITVIIGRLNVRNRPTLSGSQVLTKINRGEHHPIIGQNADGKWLLVDVNGTFGWLNRYYVTVYADTSTTIPVVGDVPPQIPPAQEYIVVTATPYTVNIRSGPGVNFADIGNFPLGAETKVIGRSSDNNWWQINYNGITGWVAAAYAHIQDNAIIEAIPITSIV